MTPKKKLDAVPTSEKYTALWNRRIDGVVKQISIVVTKKGKKYYNEDGSEAFIPDTAILIKQ